MATIPEITDRLEAATEKAENSSQIMYDVSNGDATTEVPTASGPTPTLKKWFQDLGSSVEPMLAGIPARLDRAILSYSDYHAAYSAANSLPNYQRVEVDVDETRDGRRTLYEVQSGTLIFVRYTDDNPTGVGVPGRTQWQKNSDMLSVKDFGAAGDGISDDTAAFVRLINDINSGAVGDIYVPVGRYKITSDLPTITKPVKIHGAGRRDSWLVFYDCSGLRLDMSGSPEVSGRRYINSSLSDFTLLTNTSGKTGLYFKGVQSFAPHDPAISLNAVTFGSLREYDTSVPETSEWLISIDFDDTDEIYVSDCFINGSHLNGSYSGLTNSIGIRVSTGTGFRINNTQILLTGTGIQLTGQSEGMIAYGLTIVGNRYGIHMTGLTDPANNHVISGSHFSCYLSAVKVERGIDSSLAIAVFVDDCFILERQGLATKPPYIAIDLAAQRSIVSNTVIQNNSTTTPDRTGIRFTCDGNTISNIQGVNVGKFIVAVAGGGVGKVNSCFAAGDLSSLLSGDTGSVTSFDVSSSGEPLSMNLRASILRLRNQLSQEVALFDGARTLLGGGRQNSSTYIDLRSNIGGSAAYDARILATGGDPTVSGLATLQIQGSPILLAGTETRPGTDNISRLGSPSIRWSTVYAATGTINTSDARDKTPAQEIDDAVLDAWGEVQFVAFQWLSSIIEKGESARWHFGLVAQQVRDSFEKRGIDGTKYGLLCYDQWDDLFEPVLSADTGEEIGTRLVVSAGHRWGIRPDQCLFLEAAYQRRRTDRIEARLASLESER